MKKMIAFLMAAAMLLSLAACGGSSGGSGTAAEAPKILIGKIKGQHFAFIQHIRFRSASRVHLHVLADDLIDLSKRSAGKVFPKKSVEPAARVVCRNDYLAHIVILPPRAFILNLSTAIIALQIIGLNVKI